MKGYGVAVEPFPCVGKTLLQLWPNFSFKHDFWSQGFIEFDLVVAHLRQRLNVTLVFQSFGLSQLNFLI